MKIAFFVPGNVRGQARTGGNGRVRFKDPQTKIYENRVAMIAVEAMAGRPLIDGPVSVKLEALFQVAESASKKRQAAMLAGEIMPTRKPDWDNIGKITDALNGIVWKDDDQVVHGVVTKSYAATPGLQITVTEILP